MDGTFIIYWSDDKPTKAPGESLSRASDEWFRLFPQDFAAIKALKPGETFVDPETDPETGIPLVLVHRIS